jgi:hypothetical protein
LWRVLPDVGCVEAQGVVGGAGKVDGLGVVGGLGMIGGLRMVGGLGVRVSEQHQSHHWQAHFNRTAHGLASVKGSPANARWGTKHLCQTMFAPNARTAAVRAGFSLPPLKILTILASFCQNNRITISGCYPVSCNHRDYVGAPCRIDLSHRITLGRVAQDSN